MTISHYGFRVLHLDAQMLTLWSDGTFLASRWQDSIVVNLYYVGSFFAEVYYDPERNQITHTHTFTSRACLLDYAPYIDLAELGL